MADDDDLRELVRGLVLRLAWSTHDQLPTVCREYELPQPPPKLIDSSEGTTRTKTQRMQDVFDRLDITRYPTVLSRFLDHGLEPQERNQAQDILWAREHWPMITIRVRRDIIDALDKLETIWKDADGFISLLRRLWVLTTNVDLWLTSGGLEAEIEQHFLRNPDDWSVLDLFRRLGALHGSDRRFALFLQGLLGGAVNPDELHQRRMVDAIGPALSHANLKIVEVGDQDGYPDFTIMPTGAHARPAQLILFASRNRKPDLRLRDVLDRQIELLDDDALVYDRPVPDTGLTWDHLQTWWADRQRVPLADAKRDLWRRLRASIPANSPPQQELFDKYHKAFAHQDRMLALLPEVWVHWDPITKKSRQDDALLTQRMDFLMLLPMHRRVVLEVDGTQHYSSAEGHPSPAIYAETTRGDRDLRLSGYEVYRFSGHELSAERAQATVNEFFPRLLGTHPTTARITAT